MRVHVIRRASTPWSEYDDNELRRMYPKHGTRCCSHLGRSKSATGARAGKLGLKFSGKCDYYGNQSDDAPRKPILDADEVCLSRMNEWLIRERDV